MANPGEGLGEPNPLPLLFLDQTEAQNARWNGDRAPPFLRVWITGPPLSQGLDPALYTEMERRARTYVPYWFLMSRSGVFHFEFFAIVKKPRN